MFLLVRELLQRKQDNMIKEIAKVLNLLDAKDEKDNTLKHNKILTMLQVKLQSVFQEHNKSIFKFAGNTAGEDGEEEEDEVIKEIIEKEYKARVLPLVEQANDGEFVDDFVDNISSDDFVDFFKSIVDLSLHMLSLIHI